MSSFPAVVVAVVIVGLFVRYAILGPATSSRTVSSTNRGSSINATNRLRRRYVVPPQRITQVADMFPHIPRSAIENDLAITGSAEATIENIISGNIVINTNPNTNTNHNTINSGIASLNRSTSNSTSSSVSSLSTNSNGSSLKTIIEQVKKGNSDIKEPPHKWSKDPNTRKSLLDQRKQFMLKKARDKLIASQKEKKDTGNLTNIQDDSKKVESNDLKGKQIEHI